MTASWKSLGILCTTLSLLGLGAAVGTQGRVDAVTTAAIPQPETPIAASPPASSEATTELKAGLDALAAGDTASARQLRDGLPDTALDRHILSWAIAMKGGRDVPSAEIAATARQLASWPGLDTLRRNSERAMLSENPAPGLVLAAFGSTRPLTAEGTIALARAHVAQGSTEAARAVLAPLWRTAKLDAGQEAAIIREFGTVIPSIDHRARMERMLYAERYASAGRISGLAGAQALYKAWVAASKGDKTAEALLEAVPTVDRGAGYLYAKARYLRRAEQIEKAAAVMRAAPTDATSLVDPDAWWIERRALSRELVDLGDLKSAYALVAAHAAESKANQADAEFHAGWYALRGLRDAKLGSSHFARIAAIAEGPITRARAYYWLGRAAEAGGPGSAMAYFERAAAYGTSFYGQLAADKIGRKAINVAYPIASTQDRETFMRREAVHAIRRLEAAGYPKLADTIYRDLAEQIASPGELSLLATMAEQREDHYLALRVAKIAGARGVEIGALSHPIGVIPASADISGSGKALAYAIARQESEFNVAAVSSAGARGLLQLLPGTAKDVAKRAGLAYSATRLVSDPGYNAALGAAFLGEQLGRFNGSYVLTFAGYNAGPRRAQQWVDRYGDPRGKDLDTVVDWIERIPYAETRSYVQRVMENYQVYKMRLTGSYDIAGDLVDGR